MFGLFLLTTRVSELPPFNFKASTLNRLLEAGCSKPSSWVHIKHCDAQAFSNMITNKYATAALSGDLYDSIKDGKLVEFTVRRDTSVKYKPVDDNKFISDNGQTETFETISAGNCKLMQVVIQWPAPSYMNIIPEQLMRTTNDDRIKRVTLSNKNQELIAIRDNGGGFRLLQVDLTTHIVETLYDTQMFYFKRKGFDICINETFDTIKIAYAGTYIWSLFGDDNL